MPESNSSDDLARDGGCLADYRRAVETLRSETVAELGRQPMQPEALSAIALGAVSLPLVAMMLPAMPVEPQVWQVAAALVAVWLGTFRIQSARYARFHAHWERKVLALAAETARTAPEDARLLRRR